MTMENTTKTILTKFEKIEAIFENTENLKEIDFSYALQINEICLDSLREAIQELVYQYEFIYYNSAMQFLSQNDNSLEESLQLALDMGYSAENLNSTLLATILVQSYMMQEFGGIEGEIEEILTA